MDKSKALLDEIYLKASESSNIYELIMNLMKETSLKLRAAGINDMYLSSGVVSKPGESGQL